MPRKVLVSGAIICTLTFIILGAFNNCAPIGAPLENIDLASSGGSGGGSGQQLAVDYFNNTVAPALQTRCNTCHVAGGVATASIYNYSSARGLALNGPTSVNNYLMNKIKMANNVTHTGGNLCAGDNNGSVTPCKEIKRWVVMEDPMKATGPTGMISSVTNRGVVSGWAMDMSNTAAMVQVQFYVDGPVGTGTSAGTMTANLSGAGAQNGHYFTFQLPESAVTADQRMLYAYSVTAVADNLFSNSPFSYLAFGPSAAGRTFFTNTMQPKLSSCTGCHTVSYNEQFRHLINALPDSGGTGINNRLINATAGSAHPGGNFCAGGKSVDPCLTMQQWWTTEFGN